MRILHPKYKTKLAREAATSPPPRPLYAHALTGDRARMRGAENRADAPRKHERRRRGRRREKKYETVLCALNLFFCAQLTANDALKHKILLGEEQKIHKKRGSTKIRREHFYALLRTSVHTQTH